MRRRSPSFVRTSWRCRPDNAALLQALKQWQAAYQEAADVARAKEGERRTLEGQVAQVSQTLSLCEAKNDKLLTVANDILDLYQSQDFISVWKGSYEPILGLRRVELQNIVQDYQDRILDQTFDARAGRCRNRFRRRFRRRDAPGEACIRGRSTTGGAISQGQGKHDGKPT